MLSHDNVLYSSLKLAECLNASFQILDGPQPKCAVTLASFANCLGQTVGLFVPLLLSLPVVVASPEATNLVRPASLFQFLCLKML
jgi:hypothetical protein